ncbi:MAG: DedA family protein [Candidatus Binataceae bacterium]
MPAVRRATLMNELFDPTHAADWVAAWGYFGIFLFIFLGNMGIPLPEEAVMLAAGFLAGHGILDIRVVYLVAIGSAIVGDGFGYVLGRTGGQRVLERLANRFDFARRRYERLQGFFAIHGPKAVFMARFITGARFMAGPMAGAAGMNFWRFFGWNILGAIAWCSMVVTIGYVLGDELYRVLQSAHVTSRVISVVVIVALIGLWYFWWRERSEPAVGGER